MIMFARAKPSAILLFAVALAALLSSSDSIGPRQGCLSTFPFYLGGSSTLGSGTDGFTLTIDTATSFFQNEHVTVTLTVPAGGDRWFAIEMAAATQGGLLNGGEAFTGSWLPTATQLSDSTSIAGRSICNITNLNGYRFVSGATAVSYSGSGFTSARFTWVAPYAADAGSHVTFQANVAIDASTYFQVHSAQLPFLAAGQGCVNPKTGNTTWTPYPICNGHGRCSLNNNTCICNGTYTGPGCFTNTACGPGFQGQPSYCTACPAGTYKSVYGTTNTSTSYDTTVCRSCSDRTDVPHLGLAGKYAVLAGTGITYIKSVGTFTPIFAAGDIGVFAGSTPNPAGFNQVSGTFHASDDLDSVQAGAELATAVAGAIGTRCTYMTQANLTSVVLKPGNYCWHTQLYMHGGITLDAQGDPLAVWRFIVKNGDLTYGIQPSTPANDIIYANVPGVNRFASRIFWISGGTIHVIGTSTVEGTLMASGAITIGAGAHVTGGVLTANAITFADTATIGDLAVPQIYINASRFTGPVGSNSWLNCTVSGTVCAAGRYYSAGNCPFCAVGTYKASTGDQECSLCDIAHTTPATGSTSAAQCSVALCTPGHYGDPTGLNCKSCPYGTYKGTYGPQVCTACPVGLNTSAVAQTQIRNCNAVYACPPGYFGVAVASTSGCTPCGFGTYNNHTGRTSGCISCPEGYYSTVQGASSIAQCTLVQPNPPGQDLCSRFHFKSDLCHRFAVEGCVFNATDGTCNKAACSSFFDGFSCRAVRNCRWYNLALNLHSPSFQCVDFVPSSSSAFAVCNAIDSGYGTTYLSPADMAAACLAEPMCEWDCTYHHCYVDRNILATTPDVNFTTCAQDGTAGWIQNTAECVDFGNGNHHFTGFGDPAFSNFTCPPGVCMPRARYSDVSLCFATDSTVCESPINGGCVWSAYLDRCMAATRTLAYGVQCNEFCTDRTAYIANYWNVQVPDIGPSTCQSTPGCVQATDCVLKAHCKERAGACIRDDLYACPLLPNHYACIDGIGSGLCGLYNTTGFCRSALHPPAGWPAYSGNPPDASFASSSSVSYSDAYVDTTVDFEIDLTNFAYDVSLTTLSFDLTTPLDWNEFDFSDITVKIGYGGYPGLGYNFDLSTISGVSSVGTREVLFAPFAKYLHAHHNFPPQCNNATSVDSACVSVQHQNVFVPLNPQGIASAVDLIHDGFRGPELRFSMNLDLSLMLTLGANAGVVSTLKTDLTDSTLLSSVAFMTIPLTTIWRGLDGSETSTEILTVGINAAGNVHVAFTTQRGHATTLSILDSSFDGSSCTSGKVAEVITIAIAYHSSDPNKLFLGPQHIQDLTVLANCYQAALSGFVAPTCASGVCTSQVTITTQCRTPTLNGDTFLTCPTGYTADFAGRFPLQITPWFCQSTGQRSQTSCAGQALLQQSFTDTVTIHVRLPTTNNTNNQQDAQVAFTAGILPNDTSPLSAILQANNNGVVSAANRFIPLVAFMTSTTSLDLYTMAIVTKATTFTFKDSSGHVIASPTLYFLMTNGAVHVNPKLWAGLGSTNPVIYCAAHSGCDQVVLDGFGLVALYPTIDSADVNLVIEAAVIGVTIPASRRLLSVQTLHFETDAASSSSSSVTDTIVTSGTNYTIHFEQTVFRGHPTSSSKRLSDGAIAGIVIGSFFFVVIIAVIVGLVCVWSPDSSRGTYGPVSRSSSTTYSTSSLSAADRRRLALGGAATSI